MIVINDIASCKVHMDQILAHKAVGFIPTMGALHAGHTALVSRARDECDIVIVSIFVNPTQFDEQKDFDTYPDTLISDKKILIDCGADYLLLPTKESMYPSGNDFSMVSHAQIAQLFEGEARPGHFTGMLTIVLKLLILVRPDKAYFGEKDYQQIELVKQLVQSFFLNVEVVVCPTIRDENGKPLSSRNSKLSSAEKVLAAEVYHLVTTIDDLAELKTAIEEKGVLVEYLASVEERIFLAIKIRDVRLIDNFLKEKQACLLPH